MAKLAVSTGANLHPRENITGTGNIAALNAEVTGVVADGAATVALDLRGTFSLTIEVAGSFDNVNWIAIPMRPVTGQVYVMAIAGAVQGAWVGACAGFRFVRARCTAFTSGSAAVNLVADIGASELIAMPKAADLSVTVTAATATAATLTLPAVTGMFHYITRLELERHTSALLAAGATPVLITTTNMPGTRVFSVPADAAAAGSVWTRVLEPASPLRSTASGTATTFVAPLTAGVIWRMTADYYVAT